MPKPKIAPNISRTNQPTNKATEQETRGPGQPDKYRPEYAKQAVKLCALGATDVDLAMFFDVDPRTIANWKVRYPEFFQSIKIAKADLDDQVERSLYQRAMGYSHPDVDIRVIEGQIVKTELVKHYPPDTTALIFWLKNRRKEEWRDKQEIEHSGTIRHEDALGELDD